MPTARSVFVPGFSNSKLRLPGSGAEPRTSTPGRASNARYAVLASIEKAAHTKS